MLKNAFQIGRKLPQMDNNFCLQKNDIRDCAGQTNSSPRDYSRSLQCQNHLDLECNALYVTKLYRKDMGCNDIHSLQVTVITLSGIFTILTAT